MCRTHRKQENEQGREGGQQVGWQTRAHRLSDKETEKGGGKEAGRRQTERRNGQDADRETNRYRGTDRKCPLQTGCRSECPLRQPLDTGVCLNLNYLEVN